MVESEEVIPGCVAWSWIDRMTSGWGKGSGQFRAQVEGEFPDTRDKARVEVG